MPSLIYYGLDTVDNIPSTIPLTDREFTITKTWTFADIIANNITLQEDLNITGSMNINGTLDVNDLLTSNKDVWIKGSLYVNSTSMNQDTVDQDGTVQNNGGNIYAGNITGLAFAARYRDLGEKFEIDNPQPKGTLISFGGEKEITIATKSTGVNGIIATEPALRMNQTAGNDDTHPYITWCGRVPCRVVGNIKKFDKLVLSNIPGVATSQTYGDEAIIAIALDTFNSEEEGIIEVVTQMKLF